LPMCGACREYYERHLELAALDPERAVPLRDRLARGLGLVSPAPAAQQRRLTLALSAAMAVGAVAIAVGLGARSDLQARGATTSASQLLVYELATGQAPRPVLSEVRGGSGLAFAYANIGRKQHLLVFAVDDDRRVYWYYPAWRSLEEDPRAIDIVRDDAIHEIPAAITHHIAGRRLQLFGIFVNDALSARHIEALVARAPMDEHQHLLLSIAGADVTRLDLLLVGGP
jgi:hypothetical protein